MIKFIVTVYSDRDYEVFLIKSSLFDELRYLHFP